MESYVIWSDDSGKRNTTKKVKKRTQTHFKEELLWVMVYGRKADRAL